jgi:hypothetical protein
VTQAPPPLRARCSAGEWAIVTRTPWQLAGLLGRVVRLLSPYESQGRLAWWLESDVAFVTSGPFRDSGGPVRAGERMRINAMYDQWLTPLRGALDVTAEMHEMHQMQGRRA